MTSAGTVLGWVVPALVVFGSAALIVAGIALLLRRRSPRAIAAADAARVEAGTALVELDDAVGELAMESELATAMYGGESAPALRAARSDAEALRDRAFEDYRALDGLPPGEVEHRARLITARVAAGLRAVEAARTAHSAWSRAHGAAPDQIGAARARLGALRRELGNPCAVIGGLDRFDTAEWDGVAAASERATTAIAEAEALLDAAEATATDPTRDTLASLVDAERALQRAGRDIREAADARRQVETAAAALAGERDAIDAGIRAAVALRATLDPEASARLGEELQRIERELDGLGSAPERRPVAAISRIGRLRSRLDLALGDARTATDRLSGARAALPSAMSTAERALAQADRAVGASRAADARVRLAGAHAAFAAAQTEPDPVTALDTARRAVRDAEDAVALVDFARQSRR